MDVFKLRDDLINDYQSYVESFLRIRDPRIHKYVFDAIKEGLLFPDPIVQLNPLFESGGSIEDLVKDGILHPDCSNIFKRNKTEHSRGMVLNLHKHQEEAIKIARQKKNYILTTGTGSGKSLAYIIPIVDYVLKNPQPGKIKAIIVYPMNALANSQENELKKFLNLGDEKGKVTFARYTGQEDDATRQFILANPPDIILTNYVMLELILTRIYEKGLITHAQGLQFLVLDELHTYRGRQGADVALLVRRVKEALKATSLQCVGTSATIAGEGTYQQQKEEVARVASLIFGSNVDSDCVIGETLRHMTKEEDLDSPEFHERLVKCIQERNVPVDYPSLIQHPLAQWIESTIGVNRDSISGRLVRAKPVSISGKDGCGEKLRVQTKLPSDLCTQALRDVLLKGYDISNSYTGFPTFAFRLHQFISKGNTVFATLENKAERYITTSGQQYAPGDREKVLLPLCFCRECGQEYFVVSRVKDDETTKIKYIPRNIGDTKHNKGNVGLLYVDNITPWSDIPSDILERLPDEFIEDNEGTPQIIPSQKKYLPTNTRCALDGTEDPVGNNVTFIPHPFRFCLNCGVSYDARQQSEFGKLSTLSSGGRSTDTTILNLSLIKRLRLDESLDLSARKVLSFTDNRQDASLQSGHLNDFVEISLLRSALYKALEFAGEAGIAYENLPRFVFNNIIHADLHFAKDTAFDNLAKQAFRKVLGYRLFRDLKRGWRLTSPNLEQSGLLTIEYINLLEVCSDQEKWNECQPKLRNLNPNKRFEFSKVLLDYLRRELSIDAEELNEESQETMKRNSSIRLIEPWAIDEYEKLEHTYPFYPRPKNMNDRGGCIYVSPRSGFGKFLSRQSSLKKIDVPDIIHDLVRILANEGYLRRIDDGHNPDDPAYAIPADLLIWKKGDGTHAYHDQIRIPNVPEEGLKPNSFFVNYYQNVGHSLIGVEAREHTAQVPSKERQDREDSFRKGDLPILFCSPTMELGVDIAELNAVNMRNVPPTPANYAQRSGRAGRSGQPALVFTYCTSGNSHDQYYFKHKTNMVSGSVTPPRIDLANEDLIRSHIHAIWISTAQLDLKKSLKDLIELEPNNLELKCKPSIIDALVNIGYRERTISRARDVIHDLTDILSDSGWWDDKWLNIAMAQLEIEFDAACNRWRDLYRAARRQQKTARDIIENPHTQKKERDAAKILQKEADNQIEILISEDNVYQSDFYSYRYFASEGFLPGYSFPRLPISAYIPSKRIKDKDEYLSRPRFLAITEFGPRSIVYHEGAKYIINKVNLPTASADGSLALSEVKLCEVCGYLHPLASGEILDQCQYCGAVLPVELKNLFRMQNVATKRRDRINSDEEERTRMGFDIKTALHFSEKLGRRNLKTCNLILDGDEKIKLSFASAAQIWRINMGWRRRSDPNCLGFNLDVTNGYWENDSTDEEHSTDTDDPTAHVKQRVVPFVYDTKNCLLLEPSPMLPTEVMASLQSAIKNAIQLVYQLEDNELASEALPSSIQRKMIMFYEAAEGGAGVLRRIIESPDAIIKVIRTAIEICHYDPDTGEDFRHADNAVEDCEAACYDCLMTYANQLDHTMLDRKIIKDILMKWQHARVEISPVEDSITEHLERLRNLCESDYEREWLDYMVAHNYRLPTHGQVYVEGCRTRPDFLYQDSDTFVAIYIDGYHHLDPDRQTRDRDQEAVMRAAGYTVIRFGLLEKWDDVIQRNPWIFGYKTP